MFLGQDVSIGQKLARNLAKVTSATWEKVDKQLFSRCPQPSSDTRVFTLNTKAQDSVVSLGIYFLESNFRHCDQILPYLLSLGRGLATAVYPDEIPADRNTRIPPAETFSFALNSLLADVASHNHHLADQIFEAQVELMSCILIQLQEMKKQETPAPFNTRKSTCKCMVPVLLGLCRAIGRFAPTSEPFLLTKLYPVAGPGMMKAGLSEPITDQTDKMKFSNFR